MESLGQMDFLCTECAKSFAMEVDLLIHQTRVPDNRSFSCEICLAISVGNTNHNNHMRAHKSKKKPKTLLICEECNYETSYKQNLKGTHWKERWQWVQQHVMSWLWKIFSSTTSSDKKCADWQKGQWEKHGCLLRLFFLSFPLVTYFFSSTDDVQEPVEKVILNIGFGTFERKEKEKVASQFLCNKFSETFENNWNLSKHMKRKHAKNSRQNRTTALCGYIHTIRALKTL